MKPRPSLSVPVWMLVAISVTALVVGSFGTAVAAPALTTGKVKSIAGKVVRKAAPRLSVAHATTADNATALAGQPASAYLSPYYRVGYSVPVAGGVSNKALPAVPNGTYLVTINVSATLTSPGPFGCGLRGAGGAGVLLPSLGAVDDVYAEIDSSRIMTVTGAMTLNCSAGAVTFTSPTAGLPDNQITFLRVDSGTLLGSAT
jgi:hypothetical protein